MSLIRIEDASIEFGDNPLLKNANFSIEENERVCLVGRNGAGKSSTFKAITGIINVKSGSGKVLDYKLNLHHADYDVDGSGSVSSATDGEAILASLFSNSTANEVAGNLLDATTGATSLNSFMSDYSSTLLDVDGDGVTKASTDGVIIDAYIAGASADALLPLISSSSPITTADELMTHLLDIA